MAQQDNGEYFLRELSPDDNVSGLSLGDQEYQPLKTFLRKHAKRYHEQNTAKTYVIVATDKPQKVVAYITLICSHIQTATIPDGVGAWTFPDFPAVKIARLAVDQSIRGNDLGTTLVHWAVGITKDKIMPHIGCRFVVLDAKKSSIKFYEKLGFILLDTEHNMAQDHPVMFMDVGKL